MAWIFSKEKKKVNRICLLLLLSSIFSGTQNHSMEWILYASVNLCVTDWIFFGTIWRSASGNKSNLFRSSWNRRAPFWLERWRRSDGDKAENHVCRKWNYRIVWLTGICIRIIFYSRIKPIIGCNSIHLRLGAAVPLLRCTHCHTDLVCASMTQSCSQLRCENRWSQLPCNRTGESEILISIKTIYKPHEPRAKFARLWLHNDYTVEIMHEIFLLSLQQWYFTFSSICLGNHSAFLVLLRCMQLDEKVATFCAPNRIKCI